MKIIREDFDPANDNWLPTSDIEAELIKKNEFLNLRSKNAEILRAIHNEFNVGS